MHDYVSRARRYREKAKECRAMADEMSTPDCKQILIDVAADYLQMAQTLERLAPKAPLPQSKL